MAAFALTPATAIAGVIDYGTRIGSKVFGYATKSLMAEDELFDCEDEGLYGFLQALHERGNEYGWSEENAGILYIPEDPYDMDTDYDYMVTSYGLITMERIQEFEESYIDLQVRPAQDNVTQPHLINQILKDLRLDQDNVKTKETLDNP